MTRETQAKAKTNVIDQVFLPWNLDDQAKTVKIKKEGPEGYRLEKRINFRVTTTWGRNVHEIVSRMEQTQDASRL